MESHVARGPGHVEEEGGRERERGNYFSFLSTLCVCEAGRLQSGLHVCWGGSHVNTHQGELARLAEGAEVDTTVRKDERLKDGRREMEESWGLNPQWPVWEQEVLRGLCGLLH